jgi:hypothetical protein
VLFHLTALLTVLMIGEIFLINSSLLLGFDFKKLQAEETVSSASLQYRGTSQSVSQLYREIFPLQLKQYHLIKFHSFFHDQTF